MERPLEPARAEMERIGRAALDWVADFVEGRADAPAHEADGIPDLVRELLASAPPDRGRPFEEVLGDFERAALKGYDTAGPGYLAYIPGGGLYAAAIAELLATAVNRYTGMAAPAPGLVAIEESVLRWLCGVFGLPDGAQGIFTTGGSMANLSAVLTARSERLGDDPAGARLYLTEQTHHSTAKAARLAGLPRDCARVVATDAALRMDPNALADAIAEDRAAGRRPFLVVASAGTTSTGAIDPLPAIADLAAEHGLWFHVDAAYGGPFQLTERGRARFAGIEGADTITIDPHKALFLPYGSGALLARDGAALARAPSLDADYLQDLDRSTGLPDYSSLSPELSRGFRGLRLWLPLQLHGVQAFRDALDEKLDLAEHLEARVREIEALEAPYPTALSIVAFRLRDGDDAANRELQDAINEQRRVFLSSTVLDGRFTLRACIVSHRTHRDRIDEFANALAGLVA